jgi:hypothetical protein
MSYDLAVAYRIYPAVSKPAFGLPFSDNKLYLSEICLRTLVSSLGSLRVKFWILLDGCPDSYQQMFRRHIQPKDLVVLRIDPPIGNRGTFDRQVDILLEQDAAPFVYFAEDDYLYVPNEFLALLDFLSSHDDVHFVSPYDHPDCYRLHLHRTPKWVRFAGTCHWRSASSTCLTFLTKKYILKQYESVFRSYSRGNDDCAVWLSVTKDRVLNPLALARYLSQREFYWKIWAKAWLYCPRQLLFGRRSKLWVPIPGIATHLDKTALSPGVDWLSLMKQQAIPELCDR